MLCIVGVLWDCDDVVVLRYRQPTLVARLTATSNWAVIHFFACLFSSFYFICFLSFLVYFYGSAVFYPFYMFFR